MSTRFLQYAVELVALLSDSISRPKFQALDLWMAGCMISVFAALGEFVITKVLYGKYYEVKRKEAKSLQVSSLETLYFR